MTNYLFSVHLVNCTATRGQQDSKIMIEVFDLISGVIYHVHFLNSILFIVPSILIRQWVLQGQLLISDELYNAEFHDNHRCDETKL